MVHCVECSKEAGVQGGGWGGGQPRCCAGRSVPEMPSTLGPGSEYVSLERCSPVRAKEERREEGPSGES